MGKSGELVATGGVSVKERLRLRKRNLVGGTFRALISSKCGSYSATESTYRKRIRKLSSGAAADALDFDWRRDERSNVLNLDEKRRRASKLQTS